MHFVILLIGLVIVGYNLTLNLGVLLKLANYCFNYNTLDKYWSTFFKTCVHGKALFSTVISFIIALIFFIVLAPIILISGIVNKQKIKEKRESGLFFEYKETESISDNKMFYNNASILGYGNIELKVSGKIRVDSLMLIMELKKHSEDNGNTLQYDIMQDIKVGKEVVNVPILLNMNNVAYPLYFIYTDLHKKQYLKIRERMLKNSIDETLYFSALQIE